MKLRNGRAVLLLGATSGIGRATAFELAERGYHVYGGGRRTMSEGLSFDNGGFLRFLSIDILDDTSLKTALSEIIAFEGGLDILINCAGNGIAGAVEETTTEEAKNQFAVNFFGTAHAIELALPIMREQRRGMIINISSVGADFALPFQAYYSASKAALNTLTDALRLEGREFGIKAAYVCPGDTRTGFTGARVYTGQTRESNYRKALGRALGAMKRDELGGAGPEAAAKTVAKLVSRRYLPHRATVGAGYKALIALKRVLPYAVVELILRILYLTKAPDKRIWSFESDVLNERSDDGEQNS